MAPGFSVEEEVRVPGVSQVSEVGAEQRRCHMVPMETWRRSPAGQWTVAKSRCRASVLGCGGSPIALSSLETGGGQALTKHLLHAGGSRTMCLED